MCKFAQKYALIFSICTKKHIWTFAPFKPFVLFFFYNIHKSLQTCLHIFRMMCAYRFTRSQPFFFFFNFFLSFLSRLGKRQTLLLRMCASTTPSSSAAFLNHVFYSAFALRVRTARRICFRSNRVKKPCNMPLLKAWNMNCHLNVQINV